MTPVEGAPPTAPPPRSRTFEQASWDVTAGESYEGAAATGRVSYYPAASPRNGLIVNVSGISFPPLDTSGEDERPGTYDAFHDLGFDVYDLRWHDGSDYIQRNAFVLKQLLQDIESEQRRAPADRIVVLARSMGGVVARYCLAHMESNGLRHDVDLFISQDSPHRGAYVPIGLQHCNKYFHDLGDRIPKSAAEKLMQAIDAPAARQLLVMHHASGSEPDELHTQLFDVELPSLGDHPRSPGLRRVAIADGRGDGVVTPDRAPPTILSWRAGTRTVHDERYRLHYKDPVFGKVTLIDETARVVARARLDIEVSPLPAPGKSGVVFRAWPTLSWTMNGKPFNPSSADSCTEAFKRVIGIPKKVPIDTVVRPVSKKIASEAKSRLDSETRRYRRQVEVASEVGWEAVPGGTGSRTEEADAILRQHGKTTALTRHHCYVPTVSALGLDVAPDTKVAGLGDSVGPFDRVYYHAEDRPHTSDSEETMSWIDSELRRLLASDAAVTAETGGD